MPTPSAVPASCGRTLPLLASSSAALAALLPTQIANRQNCLDAAVRYQLLPTREHETRIYPTLTQQ